MTGRNQNQKKNGNGKRQTNGRRKSIKTQWKRSAWSNRNVQATGAAPSVSGLQLAVRAPRPRGLGTLKLLRCLNANYPNHLSLPRAIGPYSVTRSTKVISSETNVSIFGALMSRNTGQWSNVCCVRPNTSSTLSMNAAGNCQVFAMPGIDIGTLGQATTLVPSAMTIQMMNPEALNETTGIVYAGVMNQVPQVGNAGRTWTEFAEDFVSFNKPRLLSAGKITLAGVEADLIPMNMEALAHFSSVEDFRDGVPMTWNMEPVAPPLVNFDCEFSGFAPLVVYNPNSIKLQFLVTVEYRLRFDISHPAASTHEYHRPASLTSWGNVVQSMCALGNGVKDIAEVVASTGQAWQTARPAMQLMLGA